MTEVRPGVTRELLARKGFSEAVSNPPYDGVLFVRNSGDRLKFQSGRAGAFLEHCLRKDSWREYASEYLFAFQVKEWLDSQPDTGQS